MAVGSLGSPARCERRMACRKFCVMFLNTEAVSVLGFYPATFTKSSKAEQRSCELTGKKFKLNRVRSHASSRSISRRVTNPSSATARGCRHRGYSMCLVVGHFKNVERQGLVTLFTWPTENF